MINTTINAIIDIILSFLFGVAAQTRDDYARFGTAAALLFTTDLRICISRKEISRRLLSSQRTMFHALEALTERKPPDGSKLWVIQ